MFQTESQNLATRVIPEVQVRRVMQSDVTKASRACTSDVIFFKTERRSEAFVKIQKIFFFFLGGGVGAGGGSGRVGGQGGCE